MMGFGALTFFGFFGFLVFAGFVFVFFDFGDLGGFTGLTLACLSFAFMSTQGSPSCFMGLADLALPGLAALIGLSMAGCGFTFMSLQGLSSCFCSPFEIGILLWDWLGRLDTEGIRSRFRRWLCC